MSSPALMFFLTRADLYLLTSAACSSSPLLPGFFPEERERGGALLDFPMGIAPCPEMSFYPSTLSPYCERAEKYSIFPLSAGQGQSPINPCLIQFVYRVLIVLCL